MSDRSSTTDEWQIAGVSWTLFRMWNYATADYRLLKHPAADVRIHTVRTSLLITIVIYTIAAGLLLFVPFLSILVGLAMVVYLSRLKYHRGKVFNTIVKVW